MQVGSVLRDLDHVGSMRWYAEPDILRSSNALCHLKALLCLAFPVHNSGRIGASKNLERSSSGRRGMIMCRALYVQAVMSYFFSEKYDRRRERSLIIAGGFYARGLSSILGTLWGVFWDRYRRSQHGGRSSPGSRGPACVCRWQPSANELREVVYCHCRGTKIASTSSSIGSASASSTTSASSASSTTTASSASSSTTPASSASSTTSVPSSCSTGNDDCLRTTTTDEAGVSSQQAENRCPFYGVRNVMKMSPVMPRHLHHPTRRDQEEQGIRPHRLLQEQTIKNCFTLWSSPRNCDFRGRTQV